MPYNRTPEKHDLGFGTASSARRSLNKDGTFNVIRRGDNSFDLYHRLITMSWGNFCALVVIYYFVANFLFGIIYLAIGIEHLTGIEGFTPMEKFWEAFFFSSQTLTTLGYGRVAPVGPATSLIATIESMMGLLGFALITGLLYGRFSKPKSKIAYSTHAVIAPYRDMNGFMFRIANKKRSQLIETEVEMYIGFVDKTTNMRVVESMQLERSKINFFSLSWTVVHPIDENSYLWKMSMEDIKEANMEFTILIKAFDDTFSQIVYSRSSYTPDEILWQHKFVSMIETDANGGRILHLNKISETEKLN
jgi:inward rectifier potassium channel